MRKNDSVKKSIWNNQGSTLITVIVAIAFVTILAGIILGVSVLNVRMKGIDKVTRNDFYKAEKSYNDIYIGIGQEMAVKAGKVYDNLFKKVGTTGYDSAGAAEAAEKDFREQFIKEAYLMVNAEAEADRIAKLQKYRTTSDSVVNHVGKVVIEKKDGTIINADLGSDDPITGYYPAYGGLYTDAYRIRICGLELTVTDTTTSYQSVISTDIVIESPTLDFFGTNVDVSDFGLIGNKGIYINGYNTAASATSSVDITGNIFGGLHSTPILPGSPGPTDADDSIADTLYGGINIKDVKASVDGNFIVSKGDINLAGYQTELELGTPGSSSANLPNVWFDTLRTVKEATDFTKAHTKINANANLYALNDLEINGNESEVTIAGNYYGYNDMTLYHTDSAGAVDFSLDRDKLFDSLSFRSGRDDADSSAIIINGPKATLDMSDLNSFVLMGRAYVDFGKADSDPGTKVIATAEGLAVKTNQQLYLVPTDFLEGPNPSTTNSFTFSITDAEFDNWFGAKYLKSGRYQSLPVTQGTETVYYAYLDFDESLLWKWNGTEYEPYTGGYLGTSGSVSSMTAFFDEVMKSSAATETATETQPSAFRMKERIEASAAYVPTTITSPDNEYNYFNLQGCVIGGGATSSTILYSQNAVVQYEKDATTGMVSGDLVDNTTGMERFAAYPQNLFHRFQLLCSHLESCQNVTLEQDPFTQNMADDATHTYSFLNPSTDWVVDTQAPVNHFIRQASGSYVIPSTLRRAADVSPGDFEDTYGLIDDLNVVSHGEIIACNGPYTISPTIATTFKGVAIINGDVLIPKNVDVDGLILATGTITVECGAGENKIIRYDKGLIQSRIEKEIALIKASSATSSVISSNDDLPDFYLIKYLSKRNGTDPLYDISTVLGTKKKEDIIKADYNEFMHYENWHKGPND